MALQWSGDRRGLAAGGAQAQLGGIVPDSQALRADSIDMDDFSSGAVEMDWHTPVCPFLVAWPPFRMPAWSAWYMGTRI